MLGAAVPEASIGHHLQDLRIQRQRRLSHLPLKQDLIQQLPQPGQGADAAAIAEINQGLGAKRLEIGAAEMPSCPSRKSAGLSRQRMRIEAILVYDCQRGPDIAVQRK